MKKLPLEDEYNNSANQSMREWMDREFGFWFKEVYGVEQFKELEAISKKENKELSDCVNFETRLRFWDAEHDAGGWLPPKDKANWRKGYKEK